MEESEEIDTSERDGRREVELEGPLIQVLLEDLKLDNIVALETLALNLQVTHAPS